MLRPRPKEDLAPPWIIVADDERPVAILPAGRPGEVADVSRLPARLVRKIVNAANQPIRDAQVRLVGLAERVLASLATQDQHNAELRAARLDAWRLALKKAASVCESMVIGGRAWTHDQQAAAEALFAARDSIRAIEPEEPPHAPTHDEGHPHLVNGEFQSDKYPTCPRGMVPLSCKDKKAQPLLWRYAQLHRSVDAEFSNDVEIALRNAGFDPQPPIP